MPNNHDYTAVLLVVAVLLAGYLWLLLGVPNTATNKGTGQKVIFNAAIVAKVVTAGGAQRQCRAQAQVEDHHGV